MKAILLGAAAALTMLGTSASASTLDGATLHFFQEFQGNRFFETDITVDSSVEVQESYDLDVDDTFITVSFPNGGFFTSATSHNGPVLQDLLGLLPAFTSVSLISSTFGIDPIGSVTADEIRLDFSNSGNVSSASATFQVGFATPVPVPASMPLMLAGLGGLVALRRRNRAKA